MVTCLSIHHPQIAPSVVGVRRGVPRLKKWLLCPRVAYRHVQVAEVSNLRAIKGGFVRFFFV